MPLIIRNTETHAEYEVADLAAFNRAYKGNPHMVILSGLPVPVVLAEESETEQPSKKARAQTTRVRTVPGD
jgi:hypothetical protein